MVGFLKKILIAVGLILFAVNGYAANQIALNISGLSKGAGTIIYYEFSVPSGAKNLKVNILGTNGDADLYLKFGSKPTTSSYDCRPWLKGSNETCSIAAPKVGTYHVGISAFSSYSNLSLNASFEKDMGGSSNASVLVINQGSLLGSSGGQQFFAVDIPAGAQDLKINLSGGTGDADLYVLFGTNPTTSSYNCRSWVTGNNESCLISNPKQGRYYIGVFGYAAYSGVSLTARYTLSANGSGGSSVNLAEKLAHIDNYIYSYLPLNQKFHRPFYARQVAIRLMLRALFEQNPLIEQNGTSCNGCFGGVYYDDYLINASVSLIGGYSPALDNDPRPVIAQITNNLRSTYSYSVDDIASYFNGFYSGSKIAFLPERDQAGNYLPVPADYKKSWLLRWSDGGASGGTGGGGGSGGSVAGYPRIIFIGDQRFIQETPGGPYFPL